MCFDADSLPPIPAISGAAVSHDDLVLIAADGNQLAAFRAVPEESAAAGVVILPDVRGLYGFYEELALRFAERGYAAVAIDYFGRTAGFAKRDDDFEYMPHVQETKPDLVQEDVAAAVQLLLRRPQLLARGSVRSRVERRRRFLWVSDRAERGDRTGGAGE
jgi:carboxymethylenebutenolidase